MWWLVTAFRFPSSQRNPTTFLKAPAHLLLNWLLEPLTPQTLQLTLRHLLQSPLMPPSRGCLVGQCCGSWRFLCVNLDIRTDTSCSGEMQGKSSSIFEQLFAGEWIVVVVWIHSNMLKVVWDNCSWCLLPSAHHPPYCYQKDNRPHNFACHLFGVSFTYVSQ